MPPIRGLLWLQVLRAGPLHPEALVFLVGLNSSWSPMLCSPSRLLPPRAVATLSINHITFPWGLGCGDSLGQENRYVQTGFMMSTSAPSLQEACSHFHRLWLGKRSPSVGGWVGGMTVLSLQQLLVSEMELRVIERLRISKSRSEVPAALKPFPFTLGQLKLTSGTDSLLPAFQLG